MAERANYRKISDKEKLILIHYYDERGMVSKASSYTPLIEEAAEETSLSIDQVKVSLILCKAYKTKRSIPVFSFTSSSGL